MAYNPINFQNTEAGGTPLSASNLNHLEQGIIVANELVPESAGNAGQVLTKTENGTAWQNTQESLPSGGTVGQVLTKTETGSAWQDTDAFPEEGTVGQVLTKSADGVQWTNAGNPTDTQVSTAVTAWLDENVTEIPQTAPIVDTSLTIQGAAADAKKTGEEISDLKSEIAQNSGVPTAVKNALDTLFQNVAFKNDDVYTDEIAVVHNWATAVNLLSISAVFNQGTNVIYDTDSLGTLKQYLTVTASYDNGTSEIVSDSSYTLSGTLTVGTSTITVSYSGKTTTFTVTVEQSPYLYVMPSAFVSTSANRLDSEVTLSASQTATFLVDFTVSSLSGTINYVIGNKQSGNSDNYMALQCQKTSGTPCMWGMGISWANGKNLITENHRYRFVTIVTINSDYTSATINASVKDITAGGAVKTYSNTYSLNSATTAGSYAVGKELNGAVDNGFIGTAHDFRIYDGEMPSADITDYITNGAS